MARKATKASGTASALDVLRPPGGWPTAPSGIANASIIGMWLLDACKNDGVPEVALSNLTGWAWAQGHLLLTDLRRNEISPKLKEERARAVKIRGLALALAAEMRGVDHWAALLKPLLIKGLYNDRPISQLDNLAAVFNLAWQDWGKDAHPLELVAHLAKSYDSRLATLSGRGSPNLYRRQQGDPRLVLARGVRRQLKMLFGPEGAPGTLGGRAEECMRRIWRFATECDPDRANLLYFLVEAVKRERPQQ